jgi:hypothetical protein
VPALWRLGEAGRGIRFSHAPEVPGRCSGLTKAGSGRGGRETEHPAVAPCAGEVRERDVTRDRRPRRGCGGGRGKEPLPAGVAAGWDGGGEAPRKISAGRNGTEPARRGRGPRPTPPSFFGERKSS